MPAEHLTTIDHDLALPTGTLNPRREFSGQRFCHHRQRDATWEAWRLPGFEARRTGIAAATGGVANAEVARAVNGAAGVIASHDADILFTFVLEGGMRLQASGREPQDLRAGDAFVAPPGTRSPTSDALENWSCWKSRCLPHSRPPCTPEGDGSPEPHLRAAGGSVSETALSGKGPILVRR